MDGYTLVFNFYLKDTNSVNICIQKGISGSTEDFTCFGVNYNSSSSPNVVQQFTNLLPDSIQYSETTSQQSPTYQQTNTYYVASCGDQNGDIYTGGGVA